MAGASLYIIWWTRRSKIIQTSIDVVSLRPGEGCPGRVENQQAPQGNPQHGGNGGKNTVTEARLTSSETGTAKESRQQW